MVNGTVKKLPLTPKKVIKTPNLHKSVKVNISPPSLQWINDEELDVVKKPRPTKKIFSIYKSTLNSGKIKSP